MKKIIFLVLATVGLCLFAPSVNISSSKTSQDTDNQLIVSTSYDHAAAYELGESTNVTKILAKQEGKNGQWVHDIYKICLGFVNIIAICFLLFVAIANILNYDIQKYAIKAVLPKLVGAIVAANLSMTVLVLASRFIDNLQSISIFRPLGAGGWAAYVFSGNVWQIITGLLVSWGIGILGAVFTGGSSLIFPAVAFAILILFSLVVIILLSLVFALRPYIILLCAATAPIAMVCYALPQTQKHFERWLKIIFPWLILPVLANFILNVTKMIPGGTEMTVGGLGLLSGLVGFIFPTLIRAVILLLIVRLPFTIENDISGLIAKSGKWVGGNLWKWGAGYGMGAGAYQAQKRAQTNKQKEFGERINTQLNTMRAIDPNATREQAEAALRGNLTDAERTRLDRYNRDNRQFGTLQRYNPYGISAALKERGELVDKNIKKAYYRNNVVTEQVLGEEGWFKHQQEIQDADFSKLYTTSDVQENMRGNYRRLVKGWQAYRATKRDILTDEEAADAVEKMLRQLDTDQAASINYLDNFRQCIGTGDNKVTVQGLSNVVSGFNRLQYTAASEIRGRGGAGAATFAADRNTRVNKCSRDMVASGSPEEEQKKDEVQQETTQDQDTDEITAKTVETTEKSASMPKVESLLESIRDQMKAQGGKSSESLKSILANKDLYGGIGNDDLLEAYRKSDGILRQIEIALTKKMPFENARQLVRRIRASGGLAVQGEINTGGDPELAGLLEQYDTTRIAQMGTRLQTDSAQSAQTNAQMIAKQIGDNIDITQLQQSILRSAETINTASNGGAVAPAQLAQAKQDIGKIIGRSSETVTDEDATRLVNGSEILFTKNKSGQVVTVDDPVRLQIRTAVQQERDVSILELGNHTEDLKKKIEARRQAGQQLITTEETVKLSDKISAIVEPHMELRYSGQWQAQSDQMKDKIIGDITNNVRNALISTPTDETHGIDSAGIGAQLLAERLFESRVGK